MIDQTLSGPQRKRLERAVFRGSIGLAVSALLGGPASQAQDGDLALQAAHIIVEPWPEHIPSTQRQGVSGVERTASGRLWVVYGRDVESPLNYQVLKTSDDDGRTWSDPRLMILPHKGVRAMSACVWIDPRGRLWVFWGQSLGQQDGRYGVWAIVTDEPDAKKPSWSEPRRIGDGILLNKPTVLLNGDWLLTASVWRADDSIRVYASTDGGATFELRGTANVLPVEARGPDEPMIVERRDGSLWMLVRRDGLAQTFSSDHGRTWSAVETSPIQHTTSRFFLRRLSSGSLLLVKHGPLEERVGREKLMAFISDDDGRSWQGGLMIDERQDVTYPDGVQAEDGTIYLVYDHRRTPEGAVLMAVFTEADVRAGKAVTDRLRSRVEIARLGKSGE